MLPLSISIIRVATLSRKYLSWVTITTAPFHFSRKSSSQSAILLSRWFVGSSRIRISAGVSSAATSARRFFCPPDNSPHFWEKSVTPRRVSMDFAWLSISQSSSCAPPAVWPPLFLFPLRTLSSMVSSGRNTGCWERKRTTTWLAFVTLPSSGSSSPAMIFSSVDFPVPLMPMTPTFSPSYR